MHTTHKETSYDRGFKKYLRAIIDEEVSAEDHIDPYADTINLHSFEHKDFLCPDIFEDGGKKIKKEVKEKVERVYKQALKDVGLKASMVDDVILVGSIVSYHYSTYSDVDIHIVVDFSKVSKDKELAKKWLDKERLLWNIEHNYDINGYEAELYFQGIDEGVESNGIYSVKHNKWIKEPVKEDYVLDKKSLERKTLEWVYKIDDLCAQEDIIDKTKVEDTLKKIYKTRKDGLNNGGEFSENNIIYKILRRTGHTQKLTDLLNRLNEKE